MSRTAIFAIYLALATLGFPGTSHAYLDPGTGSILLQAAVGSIAAGAAVIGLYWQRVKSFFSKDKTATSDPSEG